MGYGLPVMGSAGFDWLEVGILCNSMYLVHSVTRSEGLSTFRDYQGLAHGLLHHGLHTRPGY